MGALNQAIAAMADTTARHLAQLREQAEARGWHGQETATFQRGIEGCERLASEIRLADGEDEL